MLPVMDVARFIVNYSNEKDYSISNLKLQKLLYFVQAYYLSYTDAHQACFKEDIQAWDFGPVVPEVYKAFKQYGGNNIPYITSYFVYDEKNIWTIRRVEFKKSCIPLEDQKNIEEVVEMFKDYTASDLVKLTHNQDPWKKTYQPNKRNQVISQQIIKEYFDGKQ